jgi:hypothetical protein
VTASPRTWSLLDQAATVHHWDCDSLGASDDGLPVEADPSRTDEAVMRYGLAARAIYSDLKRVIAQAGGLLILLQASLRRDALDLPSLDQAEDLSAAVAERLAQLSAPGRLAPHRDRLAEAARLAALCLDRIRATRLGAHGEPEVAAASTAVTQAYAALRGASDSRFGMVMVDVRHACCNCGAIRQ